MSYIKCKELFPSAFSSTLIKLSYIQQMPRISNRAINAEFLVNPQTYNGIPLVDYYWIKM